MMVRGSDGSILSKEIYQYEFDNVGNWKKMNTSVAVYEDGKLSFEPVEVTYRTITYYYDQTIDKIAGASPSKSGSGLVPPGNPGSIKKSQSTTAAESVTSSEPKIISSDHAAATQVGSDSKGSTGKESAVSPVPEDITSVTTNSLKTGVSSTSKETPAPTPDKMSVAQVSSVISYESAQPNKGAPATVPSTGSVEEKPKAPTPTSSISPPSNNSASYDATTAAALSVAPSAAPSDDASQFYTHGLTHLMAGRYAEAVTELRQAVDRNPEDVLAYAKLGLAYAALGQHKETVAALKMAIQVNADMVDAEGYYRLGDSYTALGKRSEALQALKKAMYIVRAQVLEPNPKKYSGVPALPQLHYALGLANYNSENYKEAMKEFKQAVELKPDFAEAHYGVALTYLTFSDLKSAEKEERILRPLNANLANKVAAAINTSSVLTPGSEGATRRSP